LHCGGHDVAWHGQKLVRSRPYFRPHRRKITLMLNKWPYHNCS